jgi:hypothetical protein
MRFFLNLRTKERRLSGGDETLPGDDCNREFEKLSTPFMMISSGIFSGSKNTRTFNRLLASGACCSRSLSWQSNVAVIDFSW